MNSMDNPVVPKLMFLLNNKSSSSKSRKEAFKFRDGIIIVSTPIYSESNLYGTLQKICRAFDVEPPGGWDLLPIIRGITATRDVRDMSDFAEKIRMRKWENESSRAKESERFNFTHFNNPRHTRPPNSSPLDQLHRTSEHIEKQFVDGTDWQDRLVPSAKMEAARRKHVTRLIEAGIFFPKEYSREADDQPTRVPPIFPTRDGQTRSTSTRTETIVVHHNWRRIET